MAHVRPNLPKKASVFICVHPWIGNVLVLMCLAIPSGCSLSTAPQFSLNTEGREPGAISDAQRQAITETLSTLFGTPDRPAVPQGVNLRLDLLKTAAGPIGSDADGNGWGLFRRHCAACHGISGDGAGPSAAVLNPYPRDFRNGVFKYTSTAVGAQQSTTAILRTLRQGIPGTAMPSFGKLPERELDALLEYVKYLSIRGQTELTLLAQVVDDDAPLPLESGEVIAISQSVAQGWANQDTFGEKSTLADGTWNVPATAIARGKELFLGPIAQCAKCHGPLGDGHGEQSELYDDWNKRKIGDSPEQTRRLASRFRLPAQQLHPRNFTLEDFHGGDRPIDQYVRISVGIHGTPMPAFGPTSGNEGVLTSEQIWDLVYYVRSLRVTNGTRP